MLGYVFDVGGDWCEGVDDGYEVGEDDCEVVEVFEEGVGVFDVFFVE